jgi:branched-chain amino acid transport system substrate-binding protein
VPSSSEAGKILADIVNQSNKNVAIISENSDYANTLKNSFLKEYGLLNGNLLANEEFTGSIKDFRTILSRIKSKNPEALVINPQASETVVQMVKQAKELGITSQIYIAYFTSPNVVRAGSFVNGMKVVDLPDFNIPGTKAYAFFQKYNQVYDTFPPYQFSSVLAYDLGYIVRDAIKNGNGIDPEKIKSYLYNIKSFNGLAGVYGFDINGDVVGIHHALKVINNGKLMTVIDKNN